MRDDERVTNEANSRDCFSLRSDVYFDFINIIDFTTFYLYKLFSESFRQEADYSHLW